MTVFYNQHTNFIFDLFRTASWKRKEFNFTCNTCRFWRLLIVLEYRIKVLDVKKFVNIFGNVSSLFLNIAFWLRDLLEAVLKYQFYFSKPRSAKEITKFFAVESRLYNCVPIIGKVFEKALEIEETFESELVVMTVIQSKISDSVGLSLTQLQEIQDE